MSSRYDPVARDDELLDAVVAGHVPDDPVLEGLASWRSVLLAEEREAPAVTVAVAEEPVSPSGRHARRRDVAPVAARQTRRAATMGTAAAVLLSMGVSQAVAGNPVAPLQFVVDRAVGLGEGMADPRAADGRDTRTPASPSVPASPEVLTGRADAGALTSRSAEGTDVERDAPAPDRDGSSGGDRDEPGKTPREPAPSDRLEASPPPTATTPPPWSTTPRPPREHGDDWGRDRGRDEDGDRDSDRDRNRWPDGDDRRDDPRRPWWMSGLADGEASSAE